MPFYLRVSADLLLLRIFVLALHLLHAIGAFTLPAIQQRERAEAFPFRQFLQAANAVIPTINGSLQALQSFIDHGHPLRRGRNVHVDFLVLPKWAGDDGPLGDGGFVLYLVLHQASDIVGLDFEEPPEEVLPDEEGDCFFIDGGEVLEALGGECPEGLIPGDEGPEVALEVLGVGVEIGLAVISDLVYANNTNLLQTA